ncbi:MAG: orotate phosphoribosyltransferase [Persicimonas sp.]
MNRNQLAGEIAQAAFLRGEFELRSGQTSSVYLDKYKFLARPNLLEALVEEAAKLVPAETEVVAGIELGGVVLATALSLHLGTPAAFVRTERKGYGTANIVEGAEIASRRVCLIEDIVTTGGQVAKSARVLREEGAIVEDVICAVDRSEGEHPKLDAEGLVLRAMFELAELPEPE